MLESLKVRVCLDLFLYKRKEIIIILQENEILRRIYSPKKKKHSL